MNILEDRSISPQGGQTATDLRSDCITVRGRQARFVHGGAGPAVVLVHGQGEDADTWQWVMPVLARHYRVYALDLPGSGGSATLTDTGPYAASPELHAGFLEAFLAALGLERVALVGNSFGGLVALHAALAAPDRIAALCVADSSGFGRLTHPALIALTVPGLADTLAAWWRTPPGALQWAALLASLSFAQPLRAPPAWTTNVTRLAQVPGHLEGSVLACLRGELDLLGQRDIVLDQLHRLKMPTLVVWGENDAIVPRFHTAAAMERLPNGRLVVIPDCGHLPHVEQPDRFLAALAPFLQENAPASG